MIEEFCEKNKLPKFRIKQFNKAFYQDAISSFDEISTWSKDLREKLKNELEFTTLEPVKELVSKRGDTVKVLFAVRDMPSHLEAHKRLCALKPHPIPTSRDHPLLSERVNYIEAVLMRHKDGRNTVCVSCMVGCPVGCKFCATGKMGFHGNLSEREIIDQVMYFERYLKVGAADLRHLPDGTPYDGMPYQRPHVTNIVFMGMGEPMLNIENVKKAFDVFTDPDKLGISVRKITISTSGFVDALKKLIDEGYRGRIAISLHAPNQTLREKLMPVAKRYKLSDLMKVLDEYVKITNKRITYEYILIKDVTDTVTCANELSALLRRRLHHVNLIPYNPIKGEDFQKSTPENMERFKSILDRNEINYTTRITMGADVDAACGQLASTIKN